MSGEKDLGAIADVLSASLPEWKRELEACERRALALRAMINGARVLTNNSSVALRQTFDGREYEVGLDDRFGPRGPAAVRALMDEQPERVWKAIEVKRELLRRGWAPSPKAVDASLKRLLSDGAVRSPRYGFYCLPNHYDTLPDEEIA